MLTKKIQYKPPSIYLFLDQKRKLKVLEKIRRNITKFEFKPGESGFVTT